MPYRNDEKRRTYMKEYQRKWNVKNREHVNFLSRRWRATHKDIVKTSARKCELKRKYGITPQQLEELKIGQHGLCALCGKSPKDKHGLVPDHNHRTGKVRALLCSGCNMAVGFYETRGVIPIWAYLSKYDD